MASSLLVDVNVWIALLAEDHAFHQQALDWYQEVEVGQAALCRLVQLSVVRLLGNPKVVGNPIPASEAWQATEALLHDQRVDCIPEPLDIGQIIPTLLRHRVPTPKLVMDVYLAAFAISTRRRFVTWDHGFTQFEKLEVQLLDSQA